MVIPFSLPTNYVEWMDGWMHLRSRVAVPYLIAPWAAKKLPAVPGPWAIAPRLPAAPRPGTLAVHVRPAAPKQPQQSVKMPLPQASSSPARPRRTNFGSRASITQDQIISQSHPLQSLSDGYDKRYCAKGQIPTTSCPPTNNVRHTSGSNKTNTMAMVNWSSQEQSKRITYSFPIHFLSIIVHLSTMYPKNKKIPV